MEVWLVIPIAIVIIGAIYFVVKDGTDYAAEFAKQSEANLPEASRPVPPPSIAETDPADGWRGAGWTFTALGVLALAFSLFMKTSVETSGLYGATSEVVNLDLQFQKGLAVGGSLFSIGAGIFCLGVAAVVKAIGAKA